MKYLVLSCALLFSLNAYAQDCKYEKTGKILVSDGKNLIIKSGNSNVPNFYKFCFLRTNQNKI